MIKLIYKVQDTTETGHTLKCLMLWHMGTEWGRNVYIHSSNIYPFQLWDCPLSHNIYCYRFQCEHLNEMRVGAFSFSSVLFLVELLACSLTQVLGFTVHSSCSCGERWELCCCFFKIAFRELSQQWTACFVSGFRSKWCPLKNFINFFRHESIEQWTEVGTFYFQSPLVASSSAEDSNVQT